MYSPLTVVPISALPVSSVGARFDNGHRGLHSAHLKREVDIGVLADLEHHILGFFRAESPSSPP